MRGDLEVIVAKRLIEIEIPYSTPWQYSISACSTASYRVHHKHASTNLINGTRLVLKLQIIPTDNNVCTEQEDSNVSETWLTFLENGMSSIQECTKHVCGHAFRPACLPATWPMTAAFIGNPFHRVPRKGSSSPQWQ